MLNFKRQLFHELEEWKNKSNRKPLILRGARQVGKTTLVKEFSKTYAKQLFIELRRRYEKGIYFFKQKNEVDFYVPEAKLLLQVSYNLNAPETRKREMNGLIEAMKELEINDGVIITYDSQEKIKIDNFVITVIPAWKWLLQ